MITAVYLSNPFKPQSRVMKPFAPEEAQTLKDVIQAFKIESPEGWLFSVNGQIVKDAETRLGAMDFVIIVPKVRGGGGGGKNIGALIGAIAIMALTGGAGGGVLGGLLGGGMGGTLGLGLALYLGGSLLMGNQKIPKIDTPDYSYSALEGGHGWNPDQIQIRPGTPIPMTYGSIRTSGQLIGRRITSQGIPSTDRTAQFLYLLLACNDGELDSISDIKVNDVDIASISNAYSETKLGTNNQTAVSGILTSVQEQQAFNHELPAEVAGTNWITKTQTEYGNSVELELVFPAGVFGLGGEGQTGAVNVFVRGQYRESGGSWTDLFNTDGNPYKQIYLNTRKPYYFKHVFTADSSKLYEFRFQNYSLTYYNSTAGWTEIPSNYAMGCNWLSMTVLDNVAETYPNTALVALGIPASENLSGSMPKVSWTQTRSKIWAYNPTSTTYEQKDANNLAWIIYDLIHQCRRLYNIQTAGYQYVVQGEPAVNLDYDTFDTWATWCAETVNGTPRAKGNLLVDSAAQLWPTVQKIAASARGFIIQQAGVFKPVWDQTTTMSQIFTAGNIIEGSISGGFLPERERATAIEASFINEDNNYEKDTMLVAGEDYSPADLENPTQVFFPGLTNSDAVYMAAKHLLKKNKFLKRTISFQADIDSIVAQIGDVVGVQSDITSWGVGGRVMGASTTQVVIDQDVVLQPGTTYSILVRGSDDVLTRKTVDAVAVETYTQTLNFTGDPFTTAPARYDLYAFGASELETKPFQITSIRRNGDLQASIEAIEYVEGVFTDADDFPVINYTTAGAGVNSLTVNADADTGKLGISWAIPSNKDYTGCIVFIDGQPQGFFTSEITSFEVDATPGSHDVSVLPIDGTGKAGTEVSDTVTLGSATLDDVSSISLASEVVAQADGTNLVYIAGSFVKPAKATGVLVEIGETGSPTNWATVQEASIEALRYGPVKPGTTYTLRFTAKNKFAASAGTTDSVITTGDTSAPGAPSIGVTSYLKTVTIQISLASVPSDMAGFKVYRSATNDSGTASQVGSVTSKDGKATHIDEAPDYGETYYYWVKSFDTWGNLSAFSDVALTLISGVVGSDIVDGALARSSLFAAGVVDATAIASAAVTEAKLATAAVTAAKVAAGAIETLKLADDAVTAAKLNVAGIDGTTGAVAAGAVAELQLASNAVTEAKMAAAAVNTAQINNAALKNPLGAVASWSAKNCTTASIAEAGGVRDVSGNGNHGYAFGSVEVLDSVIGSGISIASAAAEGVKLPSIAAEDDFTFSFWHKPSTNTGYRAVLAETSNAGYFLVFLNDKLGYIIGIPADYESAYFSYSFTTDTLYHIAVRLSSGNSAELYVNGVFQESISYGSHSGKKLEFFGNYDLGGAESLAGFSAHIKVFQRLLSPAEIKALYMFPEDAAFGQITADLLFTGELITKTAQIKDAIISSAKISDLSADKINAGTLAAARIAAGSLSADKITGGALIVGGAAGDVNSGATTISGGKITASSITATQLNTDSVTSDKIQAGAVTSAKVTTGELITLSAQIKDAIITDAKISALDAAKITTGELAAARIAAGSISAEKLASASVTTAKLDVAAIKIPAGAVQSLSAKGCSASSIAETSGVIDVSGNDKNGRAYNGVTIAGTDNGKAFSFDGSDDYINLGQPLPSAAAYSIALWVAPTARGGIFSIASSGSWVDERLVLHQYATNKLCVTHADGSSSTNDSIKSAADLSLSAPTHIAVTYDGTNLKIYFNGALDSTHSTGIIPSISGIDAWLGRSQGLSPDQFTGTISNFAIYDRALTLAEVVALYMVAQEPETGQITANRIIAGAIDTNKLAAGAVTAGKVAAGAIDTNKLAAGAVTADKVDATVVKTTELNVYGKNRCSDPAFDGVDPDNETKVNGEIFGDWTVHAAGSWGIYPPVRALHRLKGTYGNYCFAGSNCALVAARSAAIYSYIISKFIPVKPGIPYTASAYFRAVSSSLPPRLYFGVYWYDSDYTYLSGSDSNIVNAESLTSETISRRSGTLTAPSGAAFARVIIENYNPSASGSQSYVAASAVQFEEGSAATSWVNREQGTITADRVVTGELKSLNYSSTAGSKISLDDGTFEFGGSSDPALKWDGTDLTIKGSVFADDGEIAGLGIKTNGLYNTTGELANSKYSVVGIHTAALDSPVNLFDMGGAGIRVLSYTSGPALNSSVTIGAGGYFDGSTTAKAHINIYAEGTSKEAIYANGKITGYITNLSDESIKSNFESVSALEKFKQIEIDGWEYDDDKIRRKEYEKLVERCLKEKNRFPLPGTNDRLKFEEEKPDRHIGPVAGQFNQLFGFMNGSTESISLGDQIGVTMKALQELIEIVEKQAERIADLESRGKK